MKVTFFRLFYQCFFFQDFKLNDSSDYKENRSNILRKYWTEQSSLVVKGGYDFSTFRDEPTEESERIRQFGLLRLERLDNKL